MASAEATRTRIERELVADAKRRKRSPTAHDWHKTTHRHPCAQTVIRYYGSWNQALEACGLPVARTPRAEQWTRESVVDSMLEWKGKHGLLPTGVQWRLTGDGHPCSTTVWRLWGSFSAALEAAEGGVTETPEDALERQVMEAVAAAFDETARTPAERLAALQADLATLAPRGEVRRKPHPRTRRARRAAHRTPRRSSAPGRCVRARCLRSASPRARSLSVR